MLCVSCLDACRPSRCLPLCPGCPLPWPIWLTGIPCPSPPAPAFQYCHHCSCATPAVLELLGGEGVTEKNVMQYLGVLEQRTNELLTEFCMLAADGSGDAAADAGTERATAVLTGKAVAQAPLQFVIDPPSSTAAGAGAGAGAGAAAAGAPLSRGAGEEGNGHGVPADDERPLSRGSLAARAARAVAGRTEGAVRIKAVRGRPSSLNGGAR